MGSVCLQKDAFWLCNAPGTFQCLMMNIFHDYLRHVFEIFIDDFVVYGKASNHVMQMKKTFQRCREVGLKLHPGKCFIAMRERILLGHKISKRGIDVD